MEITCENCALRNEYERDIRSNEDYLSGSENNAWKVQAIRDLNHEFSGNTCAVLYQPS